MFKLESYVTPLILSYVDKYVKNIKPEDSQLSLWGGDAVFSNLDLKLDVLEQELNLPFTFVNGHIHELRIHVPWTKLISEPVVITINTIECILKLQDEGDSCTEGSNSSKSGNQKFSDSSGKKKARRHEISEVPPSYVQSLINRVVNNISIVCNNLILKYVEDDIVLSLNIKSAELFSVNEKWDKTFVDINPQDPILQKVISMQDLTVCLDRRDGSGKIETYQDPLLYRCSTVWRIYSSYDSPHSNLASVTRVHVLCDRLDFSITDQQLPMFVRLLSLCLALYNGEIGNDKKSPRDSHEEEQIFQNLPVATDQLSNDEIHLNEDGVSWGSWAWSFVPQILTWEDENSQMQSFERSQYFLNRIFQFGVFIDKASCIFKITESIHDSGGFGPSKISFCPVAILHQYGSFMEMTLKGKDYVNVQMGVTGATVTGIGDCICSYKDFSEPILNMEKAFFKAGVSPSSGHAYNYLTSSLFDPLAPENCNQRRKYSFDREAHLSFFTEAVMVERFPAFAVDYLYELDIPEDWTDKVSNMTSTFLELSNWKENALCRVVLGPACLDIKSSLVHRFQKFLYCATDHDYPPYTTAQSRSDIAYPQPTAEDIETLQQYVPLRFYHLTLLKPAFRIYIADHPKCDVKVKKLLRRRRKKKEEAQRLNEQQEQISEVSHQPIIELCAECVDFQFNRPIYPHRVARIASSLPSPSETLLHHCHTHLSFKVFGLEAYMPVEKSFLSGVSLILPFSAAFCRKSLIMPELWKSKQHCPLVEDRAEASSIMIELTKPQLMALMYSYQSWIENATLGSVICSSLFTDIFNKDKPQLKLEIQNIEWSSLQTFSVNLVEGSVDSCNLILKEGAHSSVLLHSPELTGGISDISYFKTSESDKMNESEISKFVQFSIQLPMNQTESCEPSLVFIQISSIAGSMDPALLDWLAYQATFSVKVPTISKTKEALGLENQEEITRDGSSCSSHTPVPSSSQTFSRSPSIPLPIAEEQIRPNTNYDDLESKLVSWYHTLKQLLVQIDMKSCCIMFPVDPWSTPLLSSPTTSMVAQWKKAYNNRHMSSACFLCLPRIHIQSSTGNGGSFKHNNTSLLEAKLPLTSSDGYNASVEKFPWSIEVQSLSAYTMTHQLNFPPALYYILNPTAASVTLAVTNKYKLMQSSTISQLGFCIHVDTEPLYMKLSCLQAQVIIEVTTYILRTIELTKNTLYWTEKLKEEFLNKMPPAPFEHTSNIPRHTSFTTSSPLEGNAERESIVEKEISTEENASAKSVEVIPENMKVTLWMQWTLPKFGISIYGSLNSDIKDLWLQMEMEEVTAALDIQDIYTKIQLKISQFNINCYQKSANEGWKPGPFEGIVLCSNDKLTRNFNVSSCKTSSHIHTSHFQSTASRHKHDPQTHSFLTVTYTRALCSNVKQKYSKYIKDAAVHEDENKQGTSMKQKSSPAIKVNQYLSEVDLNIHSFDTILWLPLFSVVLEASLPIITLVSHILVKHSPEVNKSNKDHPVGINFNNSNLPLIYLNACTIRLFLPKDLLHSKGTSFVIKDSSSKCFQHALEDPTLINNLYSNMVMLQINSILLNSQADNPLSRVVLRKDLYMAAQRSRTLGIPGSDIEDRQYQLDICGLSFGTVLWQDVVKHSTIHPQGTLVHSPITGENPALEWNSRSIEHFKDHTEDETVMLMPIVSQLDLKIIVAPASIYKTNQEDIIVCGHSLEVNATSDILLYLSIQQMSLLHDVVTKNLMAPYFLIQQHSSSEARSHYTQKVADLLKDSGIESETSTLHLVQCPPLFSYPSFRSLPPLSTVSEVSQATSFQQIQNFVPFELLLTAGSISILFFAYDSDLLPEKPKKIKGTVKKKLRKRVRHHSEQLSDLQEEDEEEGMFSCNSLALENTTLDTKRFQDSSKPTHVKTEKLSFLEEKEEDGYQGSGDSSGSDIDDKKENKKLLKLYPFLYLSISQPHTFLACHPDKQKAEISSFDLQIKGSKYGNHFEDVEPFAVPTADMYTATWIETRPGEAHPKTGIPPALLTITCTDFLYQPAKLQVKLERPIKLKISESKWDQINLFVNSSYKMISGDQVPESIETVLETLEGRTTNGSVETIPTKENISSFQKFISLLHIIEFSTMQTLIAVDINPRPNKTRLFLSVNKVHGIITIENHSSDILDNVKSKLDVKGLLLKLIFNGQPYPLINPFSATIMAQAIWKPWLLCFPYPRLIIRLLGGTALLTCGIKQIKALNVLINYLSHFFPKEDANLDSSENQLMQKKVKFTENKAFKSENQPQIWNDDLRKGVFQFIQETEGVGLWPKPHEIVFCKGRSGHQGTMTWRYPEPRTLTRVDVYPVPLPSFASNMCFDEEDDKPQVICHLQYWNELRHLFLTYRDFEISETCQYSLDFSDDSFHGDQIAPVSALWRVVLEYGNDDYESGSKLPVVSPLALAACMRVDSSFDPVLVPSFQASVYFDLIQLTFYNHFKEIANPSQCHPFNFDGNMPNEQEFMVLTLDSPTLLLRQWLNRQKVDVTSAISCEVLEYRSLTLQSALEQVDVQGEMILNKEQTKTTVTEIGLTIHPCFLRVGQSLVHTLTYSVNQWAQLLSSKSNFREMPSYLFPNYYFICNNTKETIRFGQADTDESIVLRSLQMHAYSWKSHRVKQLIRICVESSKWKWCNPFSLDTCTTRIVNMESKEQKFSIIVRIKALSNLQKQIIIEGQFIVSNQLDQQLEVKLLPTVSHGHHHKIIEAIAPHATPPTYLVNHLHFKAIRVKVGHDTMWSQEVAIADQKCPQSHLISAPMKGKSHNLCFWCHVFDYQMENITFRMVCFVPVFIVHNHMPHSLLAHIETSSQIPVQCVEISGCGIDHQMITKSDNSLSQNICFQMQPGLQMSSPPVVLNSALIEQISKQEMLEECDLQKFCHMHNIKRDLLWPYDTNFRRCESSDYEPLNQIFEHTFFPKQVKSAQVPDIQLKVSMSQWWPGCKSVLLDVKPWAFIINRTGTDLFLVDCDKVEWKIEKGSVFCPPPLLGCFRFAVQCNKNVCASTPLLLTDEDWSVRRYWPQTNGKLPLVGHVTIIINITADKRPKIALLVLKCQIQEDIRIITLFSAFNILNTSDIDLQLSAYAVTQNATKITLPDLNCDPLVVKKSKLITPFPEPLLFWEIPPAWLTSESVQEIPQYFHYLTFSALQSKQVSLCSYPVCVKSSTFDSRHAFSMPLITDDGNWNSKPYVVVTHKKEGIMNLIISQDSCPLVKIHNNTTCCLFFGESCADNSKGCVVEEEVEPHGLLPSVDPGCSVCYTFPSLSSKLNLPTDQSSSIHLARKPNNKDPEYELLEFWSSGIDICSDSDQFVHIPDAGDVWIYKERAGHTLHLFIEPINRVEVLAKEIRSRIGVSMRRRSNSENIGGFQLHQQIILESSGDHSKVNEKENLEKEVVSVKKEVSVNPQKTKRLLSKESCALNQKSLYYISAAATYICIILCDDLKDLSQSSEVLRLNLDNAFFILRPKKVLSSQEHSLRCSKDTQEISLCFGSIQIDNQMNTIGADGFDYSVILIPEHPEDVNVSKELIGRYPLPTLLSHSRDSALLTFNAIIEKSKEDENVSFAIQKLSVSLKPTAVYLEDGLYYRMMELLPSFMPLSFHKPSIIINDNTREIMMAALALINPVHIQELSISNINILLSVHASTKLYLAVDHSPLAFKSFDKQNLFVTSYKLGQLLTYHYVTAALLRAGWVVGSLDLLGNPAGFARAVGSGVSDFILLPYYGLLNGPRTFITGVSHGTASLLRQISSGALNSMTNLATSVSKNMDFLSMDPDHFVRQEELRRSHPRGLSTGIAQGLTGFGISLLGAIAGIVEQPMQVLVSPSSDITLVKAATGIVTGMGKGLVGIVTKPIGGAAELVSQAGQGLLQGAGWRVKPTRRHLPIDLPLSSNINSHLKCSWKLREITGGEEVLFCVEATHLDQTEKFVADTLILTNETLCVVSKEEEDQQQTFALTEVSCRGTSTNPSKIFLTTKYKTEIVPFETNNETKDRVVEYVNRTWQQTNLPSQGLNNDKEDSSTDSNRSCDCYEFYLHPKFSNVFLTLFDMAQRRMTWKGFPV